MKMINATQGQWLEYVEMKRLMHKFVVYPGDSIQWGPFEGSDDLGTIEQFFHCIYDLGGEKIQRMHVLSFNEELVERYLDERPYTSEDESKEWRQIVHDKFVLQCKHFGVWKENI